MSQEMTTFTPEEIGKCIQRARKAQKMSQKDLADRLDKSDRTIQKYEAGEIDFSISTIKAIANELDIPWQELLGIDSPIITLKNDKKPDQNYRFDTLGDVINALFKITSIKDLEFGIACTKPPESADWTTSLTMDGKSDAKYNTDFCLFMENWMNKMQMLQTGKMTSEAFNDWKNETIAYYSDTYFSNMMAQIVKEKRERTEKKPASSYSFKIINTDIED